jgi:hypothetical protein
VLFVGRVAAWYLLARLAATPPLTRETMIPDDSQQSSEGVDNVSRGRRYLAIALLSCAVILYEIAITRILSVVIWYHWAFLSISMAMLGLGAPGVWFSLSRRPQRWLRPLVFLAAVLVPLSIILIVTFGKYLPNYSIILCVACILFPMLCLGGGICLLLLQAPGESIGRMYGFDLVGAFVGALLVIPLMEIIPTPLLVGGIGLLPLLAFAVLGGRVRWAIGLGLVILGALLWQRPFALQYTKLYQETRNLRPIYEKWTPTARLTFFDSIFWAADRKTGFGWGMGSRAERVPVEQYWMEQDGCAGTPITRYEGDAEKIRFLLGDVTTVGYQLRPPSRVAIVGAGGGRDILSALVAGAQDVDAVELNPHIITALATRFREFSGDVYHLPGVHAWASEGRSFLSRSAGGYDLIQISLIDSWAATAAGAFSLSENNLYTREAYRLYLRRLGPGGVVSTSRWTLGRRGHELPRLVLLQQAALRDEGVSDPNRHLVVVQGGQIGTVLASATAFTSTEIDKLVEISERRGFIVHFPVTRVSPPSVIAETVLKGPGRWQRMGLDLSPPTDDKPFFFLVFSPLRKVGDHAAFRRIPNAGAVFVLQVVMVAVAAVTLLLFFVPFLLSRWMKRTTGYWRGSAYFVAIGLAFMLVEIPWLQRFILYLGHPSYATTVVLSCILLGAALGSLLSTRLDLCRAQRLALLLPALLLGVNALLPWVFRSTIGASFLLRGLITAVLLLPPALLMGFFFPLGMLRFGDTHKSWFWAMNGAAGVLASVASLALSMELGFSRVVYVGLAFYVLAWLLGQGRLLARAEAARH